MNPNQARGEAIRERIIMALKAFNRQGVTPTQYEMARVCRCSQTAVSTHLRKLAAAGRLEGLNAPGTAAASSYAVPTGSLTPAQAAAKVRQGLCDWCAYEPDEAVVSVLRELIRALDPAKRQIVTVDRRIEA